ncbi:MAG: N-6 DNA methylase [Bacteroidota bacterium]
MRAIIEEGLDLVDQAAQPSEESRLQELEKTISNTLHALREEFHRNASVSTRQEVLDLVAVLFFAHATSIDSGGKGIGEHLLGTGSAVSALNHFVDAALARHLVPQSSGSDNNGRVRSGQFFTPLSNNDFTFAANIIRIFSREAAAFNALHDAGRDDLVNEVFSRFMSTSFVDEKEMGQYLTPPEIVRFMVQVGFHALNPTARDALLDAEAVDAGIVLDPSCGVGSFLAEAIRLFHMEARKKSDAAVSQQWLSRFVGERVAGIDKSERMIRLAIINLGLFGRTNVQLRLANALARRGAEGQYNSYLEGKVQLILTNPPFGATFRDVDMRHLQLLELAPKLNRRCFSLSATSTGSRPVGSS